MRARTPSRLSLLPILWSRARSRPARRQFGVIARPGRGSHLTRSASAARLATSARREPRIQFLSDVHLEYEGTGCEILYHPPDLSTHGMFVNTSTHLPEGAVVNLRFRLTRSDFQVQTRCEVRYCLPGIGIGVEFIGLGTEAVRAIEKELRFFSQFRRPRRKSRPGKSAK